MPAQKLFTGKYFLAALFVGTLDITAACIQYYLVTGKGPGNVMKYIASGAFGATAFAGGTTMNVLGLIFHFIAAFTFAFIFFALVIKFPQLLQQKLLLAIFYAAAMWAVMRFIVIPLSQVTPAAVTLKSACMAIAILFVCIAAPLTIIAMKERKASSG